MKFIIAFIILLIYYSYKKYFPLISNINNTNNINNIKKLKILTYNVQRLPYYFRPLVDIENLMKEYDIICLQENFCTVLGLNQKNYGYNCIIPPCSLYKLTNSGLTIYSKYMIQYVDFVIFDNLISSDRLSEKGFLVIKLNDIYIVNTHLQSSYDIIDNSFDNALYQLNKIY